MPVFDISAEDKIILDGIEGVGCGYQTIDLPVPQLGDCLTYVAEESYIDESLRPYEWYKKLTTLGARAHCFPRAYVQSIDELPAWTDPDTVRQATNWQIIEAIENSGQRDAH